MKNRLRIVLIALGIFVAWAWPGRHMEVPSRVTERQLPKPEVTPGLASSGVQATPVRVLAAMSKPPAPSQSPQRSGSTPVEAFEQWARRYANSDRATQQRLLAEGLVLVRQRRAVFKSLITDQPREAIARSLPRVLRQQLPAEIETQLEQPIAALGSLRVLGSGPESREQGEGPYLRLVQTQQGQTFEAHVFGRRALNFEQLPSFHVIGVALDGHLALDENPARRLEVGERPQRDKAWVEVCPVSGESTALEAAASAALPPETPALETGNQVIFLCDGAHVQPYLRGLILAEGSSGGAQGFSGALPASSVAALGVIKVLYVPAVFSDQMQVPASEQTCYKMLREVGDFYQTQSFGRLSLIGTVTPPIRMPRNQAWYRGRDGVAQFDGLRAEMDHAMQAAAAMGYDWRDYHCFCVRSSGAARSPTSFAMVGTGSIGNGQVWMRSDNVSTLAHEIGHSFGLLHANAWQTSSGSVIGPGSNVEYGDPFDNMGSGTPPLGHFNVQAKHQIGWLEDASADWITQSGRYLIAAFDQTRLVPGQRHALRLRKDDGRTYWGGLRRAITSNVWTREGLLLGWNWPAQTGGGNWQLLDTTPGSAAGRDDAALAVGATFSDSVSGIHLTNLGLLEGSDPPALQVQVHLGDFSSNDAPSLSLSPENAAIPVNAPVTFTAAASDAQGDELSYSWRWPDAFTSPNAASVTRSFSASGVYTVLCVVSDMKGGQALRQSLVTVGDGNNRHRIRGRITLADGRPLRGIAISTSLNGETQATLTDDDGRYSLSNLRPGSYNISASAQGLTFNELFNNSITLGPSFEGADFVATELPTLSLRALSASLSEGGGQAEVQLQRSGSTDLPLTVFLLSGGGSAMEGMDYQLTPTPLWSSGAVFGSVVIPAGQAGMSLRVTALDDTLVEGRETLELALAADHAYRLAGAAFVQLELQDNDSNLPTVSITAPQTQVREGEALVLTLERTGSLNAGLSLPLLVNPASSARANQDYEPLPPTVEFAVGQSRINLTLTTRGDAVNDGRKTLLLELQNQVNNLVDPNRCALNLSLLDEDLALLSIEASDAQATEVDLGQPNATPDPAVFVISRNGDLSRALRVNYSLSGSALHGTDYRALPGFIGFAAQQQRVLVTIDPQADAFAEGLESVTLMLAEGGSDYRCAENRQASITIADAADDPPLLELLASSTAAVENSGNAQFRVVARGLRGSLLVNYRVSGSAQPGVDYQLTGLDAAKGLGSFTIPAPADPKVTDAVFNLDLNAIDFNDTTLEEQETVILTLETSAAHAISAQRQSATLLLRDDDQPTVFVDAQVGSGSADSINEADTGTEAKFWISRSGSTAAALTVNFSMGGTAIAGTDYSSLGSSVVIPAGASGVELAFNVRQDTLAEGDETVVLQLEPGSTQSYARTASASLDLVDDDLQSTHLVSFAGAAAKVPESTASLLVPVTLSAPASGNISVGYALQSGERSTTQLVGSWLRIVRSGQSFSAWYSYDGSSYEPIGNAVTLNNIPSSNYVLGLALNSGRSDVRAEARVDSFSVEGLSGGLGSESIVRLGSFTAGNSGSTRGLDSSYQLQSNGDSGLQDSGLLVSYAVSSGANFTLNARVVSLNSSLPDLARLGLVVRASNAVNAPQFSALMGFSAGCRTPLQTHRSSSTAALSTQIMPPQTLAKGGWLRLQRLGEWVQVFASADGISWIPGSNPLLLSLAREGWVGLAASSREDGSVSTAVFDQVSLQGTASELEPLQLGTVDRIGSATQQDKRWTLKAAGSGLLAFDGLNDDSGQAALARVVGDFTLTARISSLSGGAIDAQAGLIWREGYAADSRALWWGVSGSADSSLQWRARLSSTSSAQGLGVDMDLRAGRLLFAPGEQTKWISVDITNDSLREPAETFHLSLQHAGNAQLGAFSNYSVVIEDDDTPTAELPWVQWQSDQSTQVEGNEALLWVSLSSPATQSFTLPYTIAAEGTAQAGSDFALTAGSISWQSGQQIALLRVPLTSDGVIESTEILILELGNAPGVRLASQRRHRLSITDADTPRLSVTSLSPSLSEGDAVARFLVSRTGSTAATLRVNYELGGSAVAGSDYQPASGTVDIAVGSSSATLLIPLLNDSLPENSETLQLSLSSGLYQIDDSRAQAQVEIRDDDLCAVSLQSSDDLASEFGLEGASLTLTRTDPSSASLALSLEISGTATAGTDYVALPTTVTIPAGQRSVQLPLTVLQDSLTEGEEQVVVRLVPGPGYEVGGSGYLSLRLRDDDLAPSVFISNPSTTSVVLALGMGLTLQANASDDGLPQALTYRWTQVHGSGSCSFSRSDQANCEVQFDQPGLYTLRVEVSDGQLNASDELVVQYGGVQSGTWIGLNLGNGSARGFSGQTPEGGHLLLATGRGLSGVSDSGHFRFRQSTSPSGGSLRVRLTSLSGPAGRLAGIAVRQSSWQSARRSLLLLGAGDSLQWRNRLSASGNDNLLVYSGRTLPLWLELRWTSSSVTAATAPDQNGQAGSWSTLGTQAISLGTAPCFGMMATSGDSNSETLASFDQVPSLTQAAIASEDLGASPASGSSSETLVNGITQITVNGIGTQDSSGGHFRYRQVWGDCMLTARLTAHGAGARGAQTGIAIREGTDQGAFVFFGNTTLDGFQAQWRSAAGGTINTLASSGAVGQWLRLIRRGSTVSVWRASDQAGVPGTWVQVSAALPVSLPTAILAGTLVDSNSTSSLTTGTLQALTAEPFNLAPEIRIDPISAAQLPIAINAVVSDDGRPLAGNPSLLWSQVSGPAGLSFANASLANTSLTPPGEGEFLLRLSAWDGEVQSFAQAGFSLFLNPFAQWMLANNSPINGALLDATRADPDGDALPNLLEYLIGCRPSQPDPIALRPQSVEIDGRRYLTLRLPINPQASGLTYSVEATSTPQIPESWSSQDVEVQRLDPSSELQARDRLPMDQSAMRYLRLRVNLTP